jgi:hypothetical protein
MLAETIVLLLVVPTSLRTARIAHSTKSYVGQAVLVLEKGRVRFRIQGLKFKVPGVQRSRKVKLEPGRLNLQWP